MQQYNWQQKGWPQFIYSLEGMEDHLFSYAEHLGQVEGMIKALPEDAKAETIIDLMVAEAIKTSEIEGEYLSRKDVLSSVKKNLALDNDPLTKDKRAAGIGELMVDARNSFKEPLIAAMLFNWHRLLLAGDRSITIGNWRTHEEPMQVISGAVGKEKIHFEAPPSSSVPEEMENFIRWFNETAPGAQQAIKPAPLRAALVHLYFESIHPFENGNGRIGRALAEKALSQGSGRPVLLSISTTIEAGKNAYYEALEKAQRSLEVTAWVAYFIQTIHDAQRQAVKQIEFTLKKVQFFDRFRNQFNERKLIVLKRMLEEGPAGFEGGMNARKYVSLTRTSKATATRDLQLLAEIGAITASGGGRSTRYQINL